MRTYWCEKCEKCVDVNMKKLPECKCGKIFGISSKPSHEINMRKTWSGQTKIEFNTTTIDKSIEAMNRDK